jgi:outer membrane receptor protein involved in Fe transport
MKACARIMALAGMALVCLDVAAVNAQPLPAASAHPEIVVHGRAIEQIGIAQSASQGTVGYRDFEDRPVGRVGELVENVPGVIATQHSGTGKANQYFLRGFNLDHGTDFAGFVDGVPINMRSHGHGQGYLDLNFLIPEFVERIDYRKGPYFADVGDFSAAGTVQFRTIRKLDHPIAEATIGSYGYYRALAAVGAKSGGGNLLVALEGTMSNGPWTLREDLRKVNAAARYSNDLLSIGLTGYRATWNATDQIPQRAIDNGLIGRFGNIDPYLGGFTTRIGMDGQLDLGATRGTVFATHYDFGLISNFTYFLADPIAGDQFQQRDRRQIYGGSVVHDVDRSIAGLPVALSIGADLRYDRIDRVGLYASQLGAITGTVREDRVNEFSAGLYASGEFKLTPRLRLTLGLRADHFGYDVKSGLAANSGTGSDRLVSPKAAIAWSPVDHLELYGNYGRGFHSNDVRGATISVDPVTGDPADRVRVFARADGGEVGGRVEFGNFNVTAVVFVLDLASELVFVGDAGSTEPNDASHRVGAEFSGFWQPRKWLTIDGSAAFTRARFRRVAAGQDRVPGAVENVIALGINADIGGGLSASLRARHFGSAPLIEDNSQRSGATTLVNMGAYYRYGPVRIGLDLFNVFNSNDADISYFYPSRLQGEPATGIEDLHFHPVEPRQLRISARISL